MVPRDRIAGDGDKRMKMLNKNGLTFWVPIANCKKCDIDLGSFQNLCGRYRVQNLLKNMHKTVADPGFPRRGASTPEFEANSIIWQDFCPKLHGNEKNGTEMERSSLVSLPWVRQCKKIPKQDCIPVGCIPPAY